MNNDKPTVEISEITERAIYCLFWVWMQYDDKRHMRIVEENGKYVEMVFDHQCMGTGESVTDLMVDLGLGHDQGWQLVLNEKGIAIMNKGDELQW